MTALNETLISLVALVVATTSTLIAYLLFRSQRDPSVVVYATSDDTRPSIVILVIENVGGSPALDVRFSSTKPIPGNAFGFGDAAKPRPMFVGPIVTGIPSLGPGAKRVITWGQYGGLLKGIGEGYIDVTARYKSMPPLGTRCA